MREALPRISDPWLEKNPCKLSPATSEVLMQDDCVCASPKQGASPKQQYALDMLEDLDGLYTRGRACVSMTHSQSGVLQPTHPLYPGTAIT